MRDAFGERHAQALRELGSETFRFGSVVAAACVIGHGGGFARGGLAARAAYASFGSQSPPEEVPSGTVRPKWR
jgi:hypothetical protein